MSEIIKVLKTCQLFKNVNEHFLDKIEKKCKVKLFKKGEYICKQDEDGDELYIILDGQATVSMLSLEKDEEVLLTAVGKGGYIGEVCVVEKQQRTASVLAGRNTEVLTITYDFITNEIHNHNLHAYQMIYNIARMLCYRLATANKAILTLNEQIKHGRDIEDIVNSRDRLLKESLS